MEEAMKQKIAKIKKNQKSQSQPVEKTEVEQPKVEEVEEPKEPEEITYEIFHNQALLGNELLRRLDNLNATLVRIADLVEGEIKAESLEEKKK